MCDYPGCERHFVRLDLCNRHRDRHTAKGSSLNRKDPLTSQTSPIQDTRPTFAARGSVSPDRNRPSTGYKINGGNSTPHPYTPISNAPPVMYTNGASTSNGLDYGSQDPSATAYGQSSDRQRAQTAYQPPSGPQRSSGQANGGSYGVMSPVSAQQGLKGQAIVATPQPSVFVQPQNFPPFSLPPSNFASTQAASVTREASVPATSAGMNYMTEPVEFDTSASQAGSEMMALDQLSMPSTMPMFGSESVLQKSPYVGLPEDFMTYLFNASSQEGSPMGTVVYPK